MNPGAFDVHPYLLLNLSENYDGLTTYAHEWGHAMHSLLAASAQPYDTADYPIFLAEIASTLNEQLLVAHMLKLAKTKEEKLFYLGQQMENIRGTYYRQTMFAEFELKAHDMAEAGEGLSGERFTAVYLDLLKRYHGPKVEIDPVYARNGRSSRTSTTASTSISMPPASRRRPSSRGRSSAAGRRSATIISMS